MGGPPPWGPEAATSSNKLLPLLTTGDTRAGLVSRIPDDVPSGARTETFWVYVWILWSRDQLLQLIWYPLEPESGLVKGDTGHRRELEWAPLAPGWAPGNAF
jgi:hypothetical protein